MSCKLQNIFLWFSKVSWIARRSKISFLKVGKAWNVLQASKYFSMIFKSVLDCKKIKNIFLEVWQVLECLSRFKYFSMNFKVSWIAIGPKMTLLKFDKSWIVLQAPNYFSFIFTSLLDCQKIQDIFLEVWQVLEYLASFKIFFYDFKSLLDCHKAQDNFAEVWQFLDYLASLQIVF